MKCTQESADRMREIAYEMASLVQEAQNIAMNTDGIFYENAKAYIFEQLEEYIDNANHYNQSITSLADQMEKLIGEEDDEDDEDDECSSEEDEETA